MIWEYFTNCCQLATDSLNGAYGWHWDIATILAIVILFNFGFKKLLDRLKRYFKEHNQIAKQSFVSALYEPFSYYIWFFAAIEIIDFTTVQLFGKSFMSEKQMILSIGIVAMLTWFLLRWKSNIVTLIAHARSKETTALDARRRDVLDKLVTVVIFLISAMLLLEITGSNLNTLIAFGGVSGLALAFASQEVISSFFGGLMIYITQPFVIGDTISLPDKKIDGDVEEIGWYTTKIRTSEKTPLYVPNSIFSRIVVLNSSRMSHRRITETIAIRYNDMNELKSIIRDLNEMLNNDPYIDKSMTISSYFSTFGASSLDIVISAYTKETSSTTFYRIKEEILFKVIDILNKHSAEIAFPTTSLEIPGQIRLSHGCDPQEAISA